MIYLEGNIARCLVQFRDTRTNLAITPDVVEFSFQIGQEPYSDPVTWDGTNTSPGIGVIGLLGTGNLECWIDLSNVAGAGLAKWKSTGRGQAVVVDQFTVEVD